MDPTETNEIPETCGCGGDLEFSYMSHGEEMWVCAYCGEEWRRYIDTIGG